MKWSDYKKRIKSLSENEKRAVEIHAYLEVDYDEGKLDGVVKILESGESL